MIVCGHIPDMLYRGNLPTFYYVICGLHNTLFYNACNYFATTTTTDCENDGNILVISLAIKFKYFFLYFRHTCSVVRFQNIANMNAIPTGETKLV